MYIIDANQLEKQDKQSHETGNANPTPQLRQPVPDTLVNGVPDFCSRGALGILYRDILNRNNPQSPELCAAGAIQSMSIMSGQHFKMVTGCHDTRPNIQMVAIGSTGSGKDKPYKYSQEVAREVYGDAVLIGKIGTPTTVEYPLNRYGYACCALDECGDILKATRAGASSSKQLAEVGAMLKSLSTSASSYYKGSDLSPLQEKQIKLSSDQPYFTFMGVGTPKQCFDVFNDADIEGGYLGRLVMYIDKAIKEEIPPDQIKTPVGKFSAEVEKVLRVFKEKIEPRRIQWEERDQSEMELRRWDKKKGDDKGDAPELKFYDPLPDPEAVTVAHAAMMAIYEAKKAAVQKAKDDGDEVAADLAQRIGEMANRFALLDAISDWCITDRSAPPIVSLDNAERAIRESLSVTASKRESLRYHKEMSRVDKLIDAVEDDLKKGITVTYKRVETISRRKAIKMKLAEAIDEIQESKRFLIIDADNTSLLRVERLSS